MQQHAARDCNRPLYQAAYQSIGQNSSCHTQCSSCIHSANSLVIWLASSWKAELDAALKAPLIPQCMAFQIFFFALLESPPRSSRSTHTAAALTGICLKRLIPLRCTERW